MDTKISTNRKFKRMFANILRTFVIVAMVIPATGSVYAQDELSPWFTVFPPGAVEGWDWPLGATIHLTIDDLTTDVSPDYDQDETVILAPWGSGQLWVWFEFPEAYILKPGDIVTLTDGVTPRTHVVQNIAISTVDSDENTVIGVAGVGQNVSLWSWEDSEGRVLEAAADEFGNWGADFDDVGVDLELGHHVRAEVWDDGNDTAVDWYIAPPPNPHFTVFPEWDAIEVWNFPLGAVVHLAIDDPTTEDSPDYEQDETVSFTPWESWELWVWFDFAGMYDVKAGDIVTLTYGETIRTHTVQNLSVTKVDPADDIVKGVADAGAEVYVWPHATGQEQLSIANPKGRWNVDFTGIYDLAPGDGGRARIWDEMGNATEVEWYTRQPRFTVYPDAHWFDGIDWPDGATVTITVKNKPECTLTRESWGSFFNGSFPEGCAVTAGDKVTFTDGTTTRKHTVQNLAIITVDKDTNTVAGIADTGAIIHTWVWDLEGSNLEVTAVDSSWQADFGGLGIDLAVGMGIQAEIRDENGNATSVDLPVPDPRIVASITEDWLYLVDFIPGATLALSIYESQDGSLAWQGMRTADVNGFAWIDAEDWNLEPGNYLVVSDGRTTKDLMLEALTFDVFDTSLGLLQGTAPEPFGRAVWVGIGWENDGWSMDVTTDGTGSWMADFEQPVPSDYDWVAAQIFDADGDASEVRPSQIINWTLNVTSTEDILANDGVCTLREAVIAANTNAPSGDMEGECPAGVDSQTDTILLVADQSYSLTIDSTCGDDQVCGDLDIWDNSAATDLVIFVDGNGGATISQEAGVDDRVLENHGAGVEIEGLTLTGGTAGWSGGGIFNTGAMVVSHSTITANSSPNDGGGGISNEGSMTLIGSTVSNNTSIHDGGGIANTGSLTIDASTISGNTAQTFGGGILNKESGVTTIRNGSVISSNSAAGGGGVHNDDWSRLYLNDSTISDNTATGYGGGIQNFWYGELTINTSFISGNTAYWGGGIYNIPRTFTRIDNSIISGNSASSEGGGIVVESSGYLTMTGSALLSNISPGDGDAILIKVFIPNEVKVTTSCIAGNGDIAVDNRELVYLQDFTGNWWGDASGPSGAGAGAGDSVSDLIDFSGWLAEPPAICTLE